MNKIEELIKEIGSQEIRLRVNVPSNLADLESEKSEGLFYIPLIALTLLVVSSVKTINLKTADLSKWINRILPEIFSGFGGEVLNLETSIVLKGRCADALAFLEISGFADVYDDRTVIISEKGADFLNQRSKRDDRFSFVVESLYRAIGNSITKQLDD